MKPGANTRRVRLAFEDAERVEIDGRGEVAMHAPGGGEVRQKKPVIYQEAAGHRTL